MEAKPLMKGSWGGFVNKGVSCYLGATLQLLLHVDPLFEWLKDSEFNEDSITHAVKNLARLHRSQRFVDPKLLFSRVNHVSSKLRINVQEDAHEFLDGILNCFEKDDVNNLFSVVGTTFGVDMTTVITCEVCSYSSSETNQYNVPYVSLSIKDAGSIEEALNLYMSSTVLLSFCRKCKAHTKKREDIWIAKSAPFLLLHLKRFGVSEEDLLKLSKEIKINSDINFNGNVFKLVGVVMHHGNSIDKGHYTALCHRDEEWWHYNDHDVAKILLNEQTLKNIRKSAYILLYELQQGKVICTPTKTRKNPWSVSPFKKPVNAVSPKVDDKPSSRPTLNVRRRLNLDSQLTRNIIKDSQSTRNIKKTDIQFSTSKENFVDVACQTDLPDVESKSCQTGLPPVSYEVCAKNSPEDFKYFTGLTHGQFLVIYDFIGGDEVCCRLKYDLDGKTPIKRNALKISLKSRLYLVLLRMRRDLSLRDIGKIMGISVSQAGAIFYTWLRLLSVSFKDIESELAVSAQRQNRMKPMCYKPYKNLRMIVDCAEFYIERSSNMQQQGNTYSNYKHGNTVKVLFGMSCFGGVSYVSGAYEGRMTDQEIVTQSGFLNTLDEGDAIMADRGFLTEDEMAQKGITLIKPPNMTRKTKNNQRKKRFTAREEVKTKRVAGVRIYVEHVIGKVKDFQILQNRGELLLLPVFPDIIFVASCLYNFTKCYIGKSPLSTEKKTGK